MKTISVAEDFVSELSQIYYDRTLPTKVELYFKGTKIHWEEEKDIIPEWIIRATQVLIVRGIVNPKDIVIHEEYVSIDPEDFGVHKHDITIDKDGIFSESFGSDHISLCGKLGLEVIQHQRKSGCPKRKRN